MNSEIIVATGNSGKLQEIREIFAGFPCTLLSMKDYWGEIPFIEETGETFFENASIKANWVYENSSRWALADDSGLMVDMLDGAPGVKSARFAGMHGATETNNTKLLNLLMGIAPEARTARFVCSVVLRIDEETLLHAEQTCEGIIVDSLRGGEGFGYDPLFIPKGFDRTFAELPAEEKHRISHRGKALKALKEQLYEYCTTSI
jgi:XTP/dITP diphosphohydrolase